MITTNTRTRLYNGDTFKRGGYTFRVNFEQDTDHGAPWEECEGHGIVSKWTSRDKAAGERILVSDQYSHRYYDVAATMKIALRDGWGVRRPGTTGHSADDYKPLPGETKRAYTARAVEADFEYLRRWCNDDWDYIGVVVTLLDGDEEPTDEQESLWGVESNSESYLVEVAYDLADGILARVEVSEPDIIVSEN